MTPSGGTPRPTRALAVLGAAFAANAALVVLQTVTFHALAWDSPSITRVGLLLRGGFFLGDVLLVVALGLLLRADSKLRGLTAPGLLVAAFGALAGLMGIAARLLAPSAHMAPTASSRALRSIADAMGGAEAITSLAAALLVTLILGGLASRRGALVTALVSLTIALTLGFKASAFVEREPRSITLAWLVWSIDVARPLLVAAFGLLVARALRIITAATPDASAGPYRDAGAGAPSPPVVPPPDAFAAAKLRGAASGLGIYRIGFLLRLAGTIGTTTLLVLATISRARDVEIVLTGLVQVTSLLTAAVIAVGLAKMLALPRSTQTRAVLVLALVAIGLSAIADAGTLLFGVIRSFDSSSYRLRRELSDMITLAWPFSAALAGTSLLLVASALRRVGEALLQPDLVGRTRWIQGLAVVAGTAQIATVFAYFAMQSSSRYESYYDRSSAGLLVVGLLAIAAFLSVAGITVLHAMALGTAKKALLTHADKAG